MLKIKRNKRMNIYDCRFIDDEDKVTHIKQYGNSEKEIDLFWREWWPMHYDKEPSVGMYVDCYLLEENVLNEYDNKDYVKIEKSKDNIEKALFVKEKK